MIIHKKELGENWPFTVDEVEIWVANGAFILLRHEMKFTHVDGKTKQTSNKIVKYAINGIAENQGCLPLTQSNIWADDPEIPGAKKSITPLMEFLRERTG